MNILILGANGFMGKALVKKLSQRHKVFAYDRAFQVDWNNLDNVICIQRDFCSEDYEDLLNSNKIDIVYHLICSTLPSTPTNEIPLSITQNIIPSVKLMEACKRTKTRIVFSSSAGTIYGNHLGLMNESTALNPICSYGMEKKVVEDYLRFYNEIYDLDYVVARVSNLYGMGQDEKRTQGVIPIFIRKILNNEPIVIFGDGTVVRDYVYLEDVVDALTKFCDYTGSHRVFNIAYGKSYSLNEIVHVITRFAGKEAIIEYERQRDFDLKSVFFDIGRANKCLGWKPKFDIETGIRVLVEKLGTI